MIVGMVRKQRNLLAHHRIAKTPKFKNRGEGELGMIQINIFDNMWD